MIKITELFFYKEKPNKYLDTLYIELKVDGLTIGQLSNDGFSFTLFKEITQSLNFFRHMSQIESYEVLFNDKYCKRLKAVIKKMEKEIDKEENSIEMTPIDNFFLRLNIKKLFLKELKKLLEGDDTIVGNN